MSSPPPDDYIFNSEQDWFSGHIDVWKMLFSHVHEERPRVLEIGSWEGRSAVFLLTNLCKNGGEIVCIDHYDLLQTDAGKERFWRINHNLQLTGQSGYRILAQFSVPALMTILSEEMSSSTPGFDWIYVDGSHESDDTYLDGELAWRLAKKGSIFIFDDYHWDQQPVESMHHPKRGIDAFLTLHAGEYDRLTDPTCYQVILRKLTDMRIGFQSLPVVPAEALSKIAVDGIQVALAFDSAYAMGAAVTVRSLVDSTFGRITFYIVDCGLSSEDKAKLKGSLPRLEDVSIIFLALPKMALSDELGAVWAKIDMCRVLPVERVIYLDADTLVRSSVKELWETNLGEKAIAAAPDVGHPMGHSGDKNTYFNAGVLLMDVKKVREFRSELEVQAKLMKNSKFLDQDVLNAVFVEWVPLSLKWNAQGIATYAKYPSDDRKILNIQEMHDPCIVHFTGPVHPSLAEILNPYVQPPTAKPWGYVGAPGHPFQHDWWRTLEKTKWHNVRSSEKWVSNLRDVMKEAINEGVDRFHDRVAELILI